MKTVNIKEKLEIHKVQQAIDNSVIAWNTQYVPWKTGTLAKSPYRAYTPGKVVYEGPYARYLYYGEVMGPNIPVKISAFQIFLIACPVSWLTNSDDRLPWGRPRK